jgi:DNA-binding transcriptional ArsR family regulator
MAKDKFLMVNLQEEGAKHLATILSNDTARKILDYLSDKDGKGDDCTESVISKELGVPLPTIHYNLAQLVKAKMVVAEEYHYSKKGREVLHYKLANQLIIIAPQASTTKGLKTRLKESLKGILPAGLFALVGAGLLRVFYPLMSQSSSFSSTDFSNAMPTADVAPMMAKTAADVSGNIASGAAPSTSVIPEAAPVVADSAPEIARYAVDTAEAVQGIQPLAEEVVRNTTETTTTAATYLIPSADPVSASTFMSTFLHSPAFWFFSGAILALIIVMITLTWRRSR